MSCDGNDSFGYVKIEDDMVVCYTGESNNPTVHKFCNDEFVQSVKLLELLKKQEKELGDELDSHEDIDFGRDHGLWDMEKRFRLITELLEESKK